MVLLGSCLLVLLATSCNVTKYIPADRELLAGQRVVLTEPRQVDNRDDVVYELSTLARQEPNGNFLFVYPREWFYYANNKPRDTTRIDRFLRTTIGQVPVYYSDSLSRRSAAAMAGYLRYQGYFNAEAYHEPDRRRPGRVQLEYRIDAGRRYLIDSVEYASPDPTIDSLLQAARPNRLLLPGDPLDLNQFDAEKSRLATFLRNQGYTFFSPNYFDQLEVDTTRRPGYADIYLNVLPASRTTAYDRYRVGEVTILTDYNPALEADNATYAIDTVIDGVRLLSYGEEFRMRPGLLAQNVYLRPGQQDRRADYERTNLALGGLGIYRFVRINQIVDSTQAGVINYVIQLSPDNQMAVSVDLDLNYTNRPGSVGGGGEIGPNRGPTLARNLLGVSVSPGFRHRNAFGGAELFTFNLRAGVELNPLASSDNLPFFNTVDLGAEVALNLPRFRDFGLYAALRRIGLLSADFYQLLRERATTRYSAAYEYLLIRRLYAYDIANARLGYNLRRSPTTTYRINHAALDILNPSTEPEFDVILANNPFLERSFGQQYFASLLFRDLEFTRVGRPDRRGRSLTLNGRFETAGAEVYALNSLLDVFGNQQFSKYALIQGNARVYKQYTPLSSIASRFLFAVGRPFGNSDEVPYIKQFFAGGANSMRAWAPRGLGPGGYVDPLSLTGSNNLQLFQTGDLRLELNLEYRFPLFWEVRGALFADVGNIWTLERDDARPGSQFLLRAEERSLLDSDLTYFHQPFYRQLAIGGGTGFRVDLSYFIFRLDVSLPLRYNYPNDGHGDITDLTPEGGRYRAGLEYREGDYWRDFDSFNFSELTFQLGLGYPF